MVQKLTSASKKMFNMRVAEHSNGMLMEVYSKDFTSGSYSDIAAILIADKLMQETLPICEDSDTLISDYEDCNLAIFSSYSDSKERFKRIWRYYPTLLEGIRVFEYYPLFRSLANTLRATLMTYNNVLVYNT